MKKHNKTLQKAICLFLVFILSLSFAISASATEISDTLDNQFFLTTCDDGASVSVAQPRAFVREYSDRLTSSSYTEIMSDSNWWGETTVTVALVGSDGANSVMVYVKDCYGTVSAVKWARYKGNAAVFSIPAGSFTVYAKLSGYSYGHVTLSVSLA